MKTEINTISFKKDNKLKFVISQSINCVYMLLYIELLTAV